METIAGLPPSAETAELRTVRVQIGGRWYDYAGTGHMAADVEDAAVAGLCEDGAEALRVTQSAAMLSIGGELFEFYAPAEDGTTLGEVFEIYGVRTRRAARCA